MPKFNRVPLFTALTIVLSLAIGYGVFRFVQWMVAGLWTDLPSGLFGGTAPWYYLLAMPALAGLLVALLRRRADGHSPLGGLSTAAVPAPDLPAVLGSILITLAGGLVLGPEVALISTGSAIGWFIARRNPGMDVNRNALVGALSALAALAVEPLLDGGINIGADYQFSWLDLALAAAAALATAILLAAVRLVASGMVRLRGGDRPVTWQLVLGGLLVGGIALAFQKITNEPVDLVLTSGEQLIKPLIEEASAGLIAAAVFTKALAYSVSLGFGFRGGPYFPVMFIGAGLGAMVAFATDSPVEGPALAGLTAGVLFLSKPKWILAIGLSVLIGFIFGGAAMIPVALVGGVAGRLIPRLGESSDDAIPASTGENVDANAASGGAADGGTTGDADPQLERGI